MAKKRIRNSKQMTARKNTELKAAGRAKSRRRSILDELTSEAQKLGLGY